MEFKTLYLLRHAKASPPGPGQDDHERSLNERGERDARAIGEYMREQNIVPRQTICSTATRTRQTLHFAELALERPFNARFESKLYMATPKIVLELLWEIPPEVPSLLLIGHNPTFHQLAGDLCEEGDAALLDELAEHFPTAALAEIRYPAIEWSDLGAKSGTLKRFVLPKRLREAA